jgi:hypothetical protein
MDANEIYSKTELGLTELRQRALNLPITMRSLLILVDGVRTVAQVLDKGRFLKLDESALAELESAGLIAKRFSAPSAQDSGGADEPARSDDEVQRFLKAKKLLDDAISGRLGFRGYAMMMRLQKAENLRDLHDLLPDFAKALVKRESIEAATPLVNELESLIGRKGR